MTKPKENQTLKFTQLIMLIDAGLLAVAGYPVYVYFGPLVVISLIIGVAVTTLAFTIAMYKIESSFDKALNKFSSLVMGAMMGKLFFFSGVILIVFIFSFLHPIGFTIAVLISYIYKSVAEIIFINRISSKSRLPQ